MIQLEDVKSLPEILLTDLSKFERLAVPKEYEQELIRHSDPAVMFIEGDKTLLIGGVYSKSFLGLRHFWGLISPALREAKISSIRGIKKYADGVLPGSITYINADESEAHRLAVFFGFEPTGRFAEFNNSIYEVYRRPA
jgi:hypothetical protein